MKSNGKKAGSTYSDDEDHVGDVDDDDDGNHVGDDDDDDDGDHVDDDDDDDDGDHVGGQGGHPYPGYYRVPRV